jgi:hypothetical protein
MSPTGADYRHRNRLILHNPAVGSPSAHSALSSHKIVRLTVCRMAAVAPCLTGCAGTAHDHIWRDPQATWQVYSRVLPNGDGSTVMMTLFQPPVMTDRPTIRPGHEGNGNRDAKAERDFGVALARSAGETARHRRFILTYVRCALESSPGRGDSFLPRSKFSSGGAYALLFPREG